MDPRAVAEGEKQPTLDTILKDLQEVASETESQCSLARSIEDVLCGPGQAQTPSEGATVAAVGKLMEATRLIQDIKERQSVLNNTLGRIRGVV
jgi:hypothetical protein